MTDNQDYIKRAKAWLKPGYDRDTRSTVEELLQDNLPELQERFYKDLSFGTGGLRGIMGVGTNRVNKYTISIATQGLCNYLKKQFVNQKISAVIAYDSRNNSKSFAQFTANVFSANDIKVFLFEDLRPTPELSYSIRKLNCNCGIVITASHNPPEYNGYKVYWQDGGQLVAPHDKGVIDEVRKISGIAEVQMNAKQSLIVTIGKEIDDEYIDRLSQLIQSPESIQAQRDMTIVYTPIHGSGIALIPSALAKVGFNNVLLVKAQSEPDGNFPTVKSPNPEEKAALKLGLELAESENAQIILGTDPDADRVGVAVRHEGEMMMLNGNQVAVLLIYYQLARLKEKRALSSNQFIVKTIVTTDILDQIADHFHVKSYTTLTGFKYIAELINKLEGIEKFVAGGEESYGYLVGDFVRDKDAVISSVVLCEIAAWCKQNNISMFDLLLKIYSEFGMYHERLISIVKKGIKGEQEIEMIMDGLRKHPPSELGGEKVIKYFDYQSGLEKSLVSGNITSLNFPKSNVIQFLLEDGSKITARPSGTEPKIKFYISLKTSLGDPEEYNRKIEQSDDKIDLILHHMGISVEN